jgi:hypothetical protein
MGNPSFQSTYTSTSFPEKIIEKIKGCFLRKECVKREAYLNKEVEDDGFKYWDR